MSNISNVIDAAYPTPTTFVGGGGTNTSISITPPSPVEALIFIVCPQNSAGVVIGGVSFAVSSTNIGEIIVAIGAGQTLTISAGNGSSFILSIRSVK